MPTSSAWLRLDDDGAAATQLTVTLARTITVTIEGSDDDCNAETVTGIYAQAPFIAPSAMTWLCPDMTNLSVVESDVCAGRDQHRRSADVSEIDGE
jgi:hypothetical protein